MLGLVVIVWLLAAPALPESSPGQQLPNIQDGSLEPTGQEAEKCIGDNLEIKSTLLNPKGKRDIRETHFDASQQHYVYEDDTEEDTELHSGLVHSVLESDTEFYSEFDSDMFDESFTEALRYTCSSGAKFVPDPDGNCSVYYVCRATYAARRTCKGRLHFNPVTKLCDYPDDAVCDLKCPEKDDRLHVPADCSSYLECNAGVGKYVKCPTGLHYNAVTKLCDKPANAACEITCPNYDTLMPLPGRCNMYIKCQGGVATIHLCQRGLHFNPFELKCYIPKDEECSPECLNPDGYFPVLGQCHLYIRCENNHPKVYACPSGLHFNFYLRSCDVPKEDGCGFKCKELYGFFPFPGVCSYYFKCLNGIPYLQRCKGEMEFNPDVNQCDYTVKDNCLPYCPERNGIFPIQKRCDHYIRCVDGYGIVKRCPPGLHYNAVFQYCDFPERAKCIPKCPQPYGLFPLPGRCNEYFICQESRAYLRTCGQALHFNARTLACEWAAVESCKITCPQQEAYYPVQGDCHTFVKCSDGLPTLRRCPEGKEFSVYSASCESPGRSDCGYACLGDDIVEAFPGHCDSYLLCTDKDAFMDTCSPGLLFNSYTNSCDLKEKVNCSVWIL